MTVIWFGRFGDIPGVDYTPPVVVDRSRLPRVGERPELSRWTGGESLTWGGGTTSSSPAHERAFGGDLTAMTTQQLLSHLAEALELPGEPSDYHFGIQGVLEALWKRRREDSGVLGWIEALGWLNIRLVVAVSGAASHVVDDELRYYRIVAFSHLITLYEREGAWREALEVAEIGERLGQSVRLDELLDRVALLDAESA